VGGGIWLFLLMVSCYRQCSDRRVEGICFSSKLMDEVDENVGACHLFISNLPRLVCDVI
jgi:hypothetical protein